jgi:hypothetical protein
MRDEYPGHKITKSILELHKNPPADTRASKAAMAHGTYNK